MEKKDSKNEGIAMSGGSINASNLAVGKNAAINQEKEVNRSDSAESGKGLSDAQVSKLKKLVATDKAAEVISELLEYLKEDKERLNMVIMQSSKLKMLKEQVGYGVISHDQMQIDKAKINAGLLALLDDL